MQRGLDGQHGSGGDATPVVDVVTIEGGPSCRLDLTPVLYRVVGEVAVGLDPEGVVVDEVSNLAYVSCSRSNAVTIVDLERLEVVGSIAVGAEPIDIAIDRPTRRLFTADARSDQVTVIDAATNTVTGTVGVGSYPSGLAICPVRRRLYSGDSAGSTVSVVDLDTLERIGVVDAELGAGAISIDPSGDRVYCVNFLASSLTVIDAESLSVVGRLELPDGPCATGVDPLTGDVFVADSLASTVTRIDPRRIEKIGEIPVPNAPVGLTVGVAGDRLYTGNRGDGSVSVLGLDGVEWSRIPVGAAPGGVTEHPRVPRRMLVANAGSGSLTVFDDLAEGPPPAPIVDPPNPLVGTRLPDLELPDLRSGELRRLGSWAGRKYVLNVFASW